MCGLEGTVDVAGEDMVGCPGVCRVGSCAAEVAGDGGCSDVCGFLPVAPSVQRGSFVYFAVHGTDVESAAVKAGDGEASGFTGVAAAHDSPPRGSSRRLDGFLYLENPGPILIPPRVRRSDRR